MKKILYTKFQNIDDLLGQMAKNKDIHRAITRNNLYKFWSKVAGEKFAQNSRPYSMLKGSVMVVACKSPIVAQELMLRKNQILEKLKPYTDSLNIKVNDIKFDPKKWVEDN
jgi:predicted nucleic acid-binding Zn ribbon protein